MHVRMAHWNCRRDCWDEAAALFESGAVPIMQKEDGFVRAMLLGPSDDVGRIAFTVWSDEASYRRFAASDAMKTITEMFAHMYVEGALPTPVEYKVWAQGKKK